MAVNVLRPRCVRAVRSRTLLSIYLSNMSHNAVSIYFMHMCNVIAAVVVTVHKQHCDVYSPWSRRYLAVQKLCARAHIMSRRVAGKGRCLWVWNHLLFANSFSKGAISTGAANFKHTSSKIWPLISRKMDTGDFNNRNTPMYVKTQLNHMRRILSYIQLCICHGTDKAIYRRVRNIYKKFAPLTLHDNTFYCGCW